MVTTEWFTNIDDINDALFIRKVVFVDEFKKSKEKEQDKNDEGAIHLIVYENGNAVATGRLSFFDDNVKLGRIAVLKEHRKNGYGDLVVRMLIRKAFLMGFNTKYINAHNGAIKFYEKFGFTKCDNFFNDELDNSVIMVHNGDIKGCC